MYDKKRASSVRLGGQFDAISLKLGKSWNNRTSYDLTSLKLEEIPTVYDLGTKGMNMSEISVIGNTAAGAARQTAPTTAPVEVVAPEATAEIASSSNVEATLTTDRVEISQQAQLLEKIHQLPDVRQDKIDAITDSIANNTYLTEDKLDIAVNRMIDEMMGS